MLKQESHVLKVKKQALDEIVKQAEREKPLEACGYLGVKGTVGERAFPMTNIDKSEIHFSFDPKEQFQTVKKARNNGLSLSVVYHSHPNSPARPSAEDIRLAYDPNLTYLIVSLAQSKPEIKAYKIREGTVLEQSIEMIE